MPKMAFLMTDLVYATSNGFDIPDLGLLRFSKAGLGIIEWVGIKYKLLGIRSCVSNRLLLLSYSTPDIYIYHNL